MITATNSDNQLADKLTSADAEGARQAIKEAIGEATQPDVKAEANALLSFAMASMVVENNLNQAALEDGQDVLGRLKELKALELRNEEGEKTDQVRQGLAE